VIGIGAGLVATRAMRTMLFDVEPGDPGTFIAVALLLVATGVLAAWIPATQASRADPATALRAD
jgi:putative ABC transport system permease protein